MTTTEILIVDDDTASRRLLRVILEAAGFKIVEASNGLEALKLLDSEPVIAIVSDIFMPHMDGYRLCHAVRKSAVWCELPIIIYSATFTSTGDEKLALDLGADKVLRKPATAKVIRDAVVEVIEGTIRRPPAPMEAPAELAVMKEYSERLVAKLEKRCLDLEQQNKKLRAMHGLPESGPIP